MQQGFLFSQAWQRYVGFLAVLIGAGLFASGIVTFGAANWDYLSKMQKLYTNQGLFVLMSLLSLFFYWQEIHKSKQIKTHLALFISTVLIGALLALIGQIYQTGADPWQLFALWAVLQLPLLWALPNVASSLLFIAVANVAAYLYDQRISFGFQPVIMLFVLNAVFILLAENKWLIFREKGRVALTVLHLCLALSGCLLIIEPVWDLAVFVIFAGIFSFYYKFRQDIWVLTIYFCAIISGLDIFLIKGNYEYSANYLAMWLFAPLLTFSGIVIWLKYIQSWFAKHHPEKKLPNIVNLILLGLLVLAMAMFLIWCFGVLGADLWLIPIVAIISIGAGLVIQQSENKPTPLSEICIANGLIWGFVYTYEPEIDPQLLLWGIILVYSAVYYLIKAYWLRFIAAFLIIAAGLQLLGYDLLGNLFIGEFEQWKSNVLSVLFNLPFLVVFWAAYDPEVFIRRRAALMPIFWAFIAMSLWHSRTYLFNIYDFGMADSVPEIQSLGQFFSVVSGGFFERNEKTIFWFIRLLIGFSTVITYLLLSRKQGFNLWQFAVLLLINLGFIHLPIISLALSLLLLAYPLKSRNLWGGMIVALIVILAGYYYSLVAPLLYKSFLLMVSGVLLGGLWFTMPARTRNSEKTSTKLTALWDKTSAAILATLALTLGIANYAISQNEAILQSDKSFVLRIAPVDPRSLMQGDYMALSYQVIDQAMDAIEGREVRAAEPFVDEETGAAGVEAQDSEDEVNETYQAYEYEDYEERKRQRNGIYYILLKTNPQGVAEFCRLEREIPQHFEGCDQGVYFTINRQNYSTANHAGKSYFFPEGKGSHYAEAQYGEFRFKDGKALLLRLLDKNLQPL